MMRAHSHRSPNLRIKLLYDGAKLGNGKHAVAVGVGDAEEIGHALHVTLLGPPKLVKKRLTESGDRIAGGPETALVSCKRTN